MSAPCPHCGRNRYRACCDLGIVPEYREWDGDGSLVAFVVSLNLRRRHLDSSQKAFVGLKILPLLETEAKERQLSALKQNQNETPLGNSFPNGKATDQAAAIVGTNGRYISDAKKLVEEAPQLAERMRSGDLTIPQAKQELKKQQA